MIMLDLNVILDVVQRREPHYAASAAVLSRVVRGQCAASVPAHAMTILHYIVARHNNRRKADDLMDWLLRYCDVATEGKREFERARQLALNDFEDAVVASCAESSGCECIVTRNVADFPGLSLPVLTPAEFLERPVSG